jgi:hypothetical protein
MTFTLEEICALVKITQGLGDGRRELLDFQDLLTAVARGSILMLDNLGLYVRERDVFGDVSILDLARMPDDERKAKFLQAVVEAARRIGIEVEEAKA